MLLFVISFLIYMFPFFVLSYMAAEIYLRNPSIRLHRIAAGLFILFSIISISTLMSNVFPSTLRESLALLLDSIGSFAVLTFVLLFAKELTALHPPSGKVFVHFLCYIPAIAGLVVFTHPKWLFLTPAYGRYWIHEQMSEGLILLIVAGAVYTMALSLVWILSAIRTIRSEKAERRHDSKQQLLYCSYGIAGAGAWAIAFLPLQNGIPALQHLDIAEPVTYSLLIFSAFIRYAMVNFALMPSAESKYRALHDLSPAPILLLDGFFHIREANPAAIALFDLDILAADAEGFINLFDLITKEGPAGGEAPQLLVGEYSYCKDGQKHYLNARSNYVGINGGDSICLILTDITSYKIAEQQIRYMAIHDSLTELSNRFHFNEVLQVLCATKPAEPSIAVAMIDLDGFKQVNDSRGHHAGDMLLKELSRRLKEAAADAACVARLGGDEFAMILTEQSLEQAERTAAQICWDLRQPFVYEQDTLNVSASVGLCWMTGHPDPEQLLREADRLMYEVKSSGKNRYKFQVIPSA